MRSGSMELFSIAGKRALITGASRGIGRGLALGFAAAGAHLALLAPPDGADLETTAEACRESGVRVLALSRGVPSDESEAESLIQSVVGELGRIDILINVAGVNFRSSAEEFPMDAWDQVFSVNIRSLFLLCRFCGRQMLRQGRGKIINVASLLSFSGGWNVPAYAASKGAVAQLTKALANEWAGRGINVNALAPGYIETDMTKPLKDDPVRGAEIAGRIPAGRWGQPADLLGAAIFLGSAASDYVHGHLLVVDGGWLAR